MLKAEVDKVTTKIEICGDLQSLCNDLANLLRGINGKLNEHSSDMGHQFRVLFTTGFMDGICFDSDREHMEAYLEEGDKMHKTGKALETLLKLLKDSDNSDMNKMAQGLMDILGGASGETE